MSWWSDFPHADVLMPDRIDAASVMFTHNVEAEIFERHASRSNGALALDLGDQSRKMTRFEGATLRRFDSVIAVSRRDADALSQRYGLPAWRQSTPASIWSFSPPRRPRGRRSRAGRGHPGVHRHHELARQCGRHPFSAR